MFTDPSPIHHPTMKRVLLALLVATQQTAALIEKRPEIQVPDHVGHGAHYVPPGHDPQPTEVGGPRPGDPGFGIHTPPNRHTRGEGNEHDRTHHLMQIHFDEQIQAMHDEAKDIHHKHGHESSEAHDHDLKIQKVRNRRHALNFKQNGMTEEEYDHLVELKDQLADMMHMCVDTVDIVVWYFPGLCWMSAVADLPRITASVLLVCNRTSSHTAKARPSRVSCVSCVSCCQATPSRWRRGPNGRRPHGTSVRFILWRLLT